MKWPKIDDDLKTDEKILATEGVLGVISGLTMVAHPKTAHVRTLPKLAFAPSIHHKKR